MQNIFQVYFGKRAIHEQQVGPHFTNVQRVRIFIAEGKDYQKFNEPAVLLSCVPTEGCLDVKFRCHILMVGDYISNRFVLSSAEMDRKF